MMQQGISLNSQSMLKYYLDRVKLSHRLKNINESRRWIIKKNIIILKINNMYYILLLKYHEKKIFSQQ